MPFLTLFNQLFSLMLVTPWIATELLVAGVKKPEPECEG